MIHNQPTPAAAPIAPTRTEIIEPTNEAVLTWIPVGWSTSPVGKNALAQSQSTLVRFVETFGSDAPAIFRLALQPILDSFNKEGGAFEQLRQYFEFVFNGKTPPTPETIVDLEKVVLKQNSYVASFGTRVRDKLRFALLDACENTVDWRKKLH